MITRRTRLQLIAFAVITLLGVSYVGSRYARLDRYFYADSYTVTAHLAGSGGIFAGGEVTYRGVGVGEVSRLTLTEDGVDVDLQISRDQDRIPADTLAVVGNKSAVGEQYVELQPRRDDGPYLRDGSQIQQQDTTLPLPTETLLADLSTTVESVDKQALTTTIDELGAAFAGTGRDLQRIIDTGGSFVDAANENFDVTRDLIRDSNTVLRGQVDSESAIGTFAAQLALFSDVLAGADPDLRLLIENGSAATVELRTFLEENGVELGDLLNNLVTTGEIVVAHLDGIEQLLVVYPYVVEGGFTVVAKSPDTGLYDAHFGLIITDQAVCHRGYGGTDTRPPQDGSNRPMNQDARCAEPATESNARGAQNLVTSAQRAPASYDGSPVVAAYDPATGMLTWGDPEPGDASPPPTLGEESWKWLFLQPLTSPE